VREIVRVRKIIKEERFTQAVPLRHEHAEVRLEGDLQGLVDVDEEPSREPH
jgi:hypothetical protein